MFYELDYKNERQCAETSDCMTGEEVLEIWIENAVKLLIGKHLNFKQSITVI